MDSRTLLVPVLAACVLFPLRDCLRAVGLDSDHCWTGKT